MKTKSIAKFALPIAALFAFACNKPASASDAPVAGNAGAEATQVVAIAVGSDGFQPSSVRATKGQKLTLRFTRNTDSTCAKAVSFPELGIKKDLPLNQPATIEIPTTEARTTTFQCGMGMYKSSVVAQ
jgi:plastocyanin domain-containing protein